MNDAESALRKILEGERGRIRPLSPSEIDLFIDYYRLILKWNPLLHLTTLTSPADFALRQLGEALIAEEYLLGSISEFWDIGSGAGIPGLPVAIRRPALKVRLIESNRRKAIFLDEVAAHLNLYQVNVLNERFSRLSPPNGVCLSARAVERMESMVEEILSHLAVCQQILLFGNRELETNLGKIAVSGWILEAVLLPASKDRFLYHLRRST
jgi:16S rRNA (guanine527-N7)-methyltransferase